MRPGGDPGGGTRCWNGRALREGASGPQPLSAGPGRRMKEGGLRRGGGLRGVEAAGGARNPNVPQGAQGSRGGGASVRVLGVGGGVVGGRRGAGDGEHRGGGGGGAATPRRHGGPRDALLLRLSLGLARSARELGGLVWERLRHSGRGGGGGGDARRQLRSDTRGERGRPPRRAEGRAGEERGRHA